MAKRARRWAAIMVRFNEDRKEWAEEGEEPWTEKRLKALRDAVNAPDCKTIYSPQEKNVTGQFLLPQEG